MNTPSVSIVIPALNEAAQLGERLTELRSLVPPPMECIVVDGGSEDGTVDEAARYATVLHGPRGRALQMNLGAHHARGDVLLFLHADTQLPAASWSAMMEALTDPQVEAGAFRLQFDRSAPWLNFYSRCTYLDTPLICFGDRGLFVRNSAFEALGGFPDQPVFEDLDMVRALHRRGGFRFLDAPAITSARRFEDYGHVRQQLRNLVLWSGYLIGFPLHRLARFYSYSES